jgi:NADH-quinone oxidoreductase chain I
LSNHYATSFADYWRIFWRGITTAIAGLRVTLKYLTSRPITVEYPDVLPEVPEQWRGWHAYEVDRCIMCRLCERICPIQCITIETEGAGKERKVARYEIDYGLCLFCNLCSEVCPVLCLWMTADWDLACYKRSDIVIPFHTYDPNEERKRLWPSLVNHPLRVGKKPPGGTGDATPAEKPKAAAPPAQPEESAT